MNTELTKAAHGARRQQVIAAATVPVFFGLVACTGRDERMGEVANAVTVTCVDIVADRDATLSDPPMAKNFGTKPILRVGGKDETVLHFDLGSVPATSVIDRATLQLFVAESESSTPIFVHRATQNWSEETITFANFGQAFAPNVIAGFVTTSTNVMKNVDITQQVTRWLSGEHTNHGLVLVSAANEKAVIISREGGTAAQKPQLRIRCTDPVLVEVSRRSHRSGHDQRSEVGGPRGWLARERVECACVRRREGLLGGCAAVLGESAASEAGQRRLGGADREGRDARQPHGERHPRHS